MKYEVEILVACIDEDDKSAFRSILDGEVYDVITVIEGGELMDEEEARKELAKLSATATRLDDGTVEVRVPILACGEEELEEDVDEGEEPFYYLSELEEIDHRDFDEESMALLLKMAR